MEDRRLKYLSSMKGHKIIGYTRDNAKGKVVSRHLKDLSNTLNCGGGSTQQYLLVPVTTSRIVAMRGRGENNIQKMEPQKQRITNTITTVKKDNLLLQMVRYRVRKLTERECLRLMGVSEENIVKLCNNGVSKSQLYKQAGNSIVVNCLTQIFRKMFVDQSPEDTKQLSLFD